MGMEIQNAYKQKMAAQLKEWGAQIDLMEAKIANVSADVEVKRANELYELREKLDSASKKMSEYEKTTGEAWDEIKVTADVIWDDIKAGLAAAHLKFK
jgi:recombinational DNA repair ATPase RecF